MTAFAGDGSGLSREIGSTELPARGWTQYSRIFEGTGITSGWVVVEKTGGPGSFDAYGVINDDVTSDGSYVLPTSGSFAGDRITVPVLVESPTLRSELVRANRGAEAVTLTLRYAEA